VVFILAGRNSMAVILQLSDTNQAATRGGNSAMAAVWLARSSCMLNFEAGMIAASWVTLCRIGIEAAAPWREYIKCLMKSRPGGTQ